MRPRHLSVIEGGKSRPPDPAPDFRKICREAELQIVDVAANAHLELHHARRHCLKLKHELLEPHIPEGFHNWVVSGQVQCLQRAYEQLGRLLDCFTDEARRRGALS